MENVNKRATGDREEVQESLRQQKLVQKRVFDLEHFLLQNKEAHTVFDEFERRFSEFVVEQNIIKAQIRDDRLVVEEKLKLMNKREDNMDRTLEIYVSCASLSLTYTHRTSNCAPSNGMSTVSKVASSLSGRS